MNKQGFENKAYKVNKDIRDKKAGDIINIDVDKNGVAIDKYWRRRQKDSVLDNCIEEIKQKKEAKK